MDRFLDKLKQLLPAKTNTAAKRKKQNAGAPQTAAGLLLRLHSLVRQQNKTEALLRQNIEKIMEYKHREVTEAYCEKCDDAIAAAYFAEGGILFHANILLEQVSLLDPEYDTVKTMVIRCYNSAISHMCAQTQKLERECWGWVQRVKDAEQDYREEASFCKAIGYVPCRDRIRSLKGMSPQQLARELPEVQQLVQANAQIVGQLLRRCAEPASPVALQYTNLLKELRSLLGGASVSRLGSEEGWSPGEYAAAVTRFAEDIRERVLLKYPRPGR